MADSSMGERKSGALVMLLAQVTLVRKVSPWEKRWRTSTQPALYQLRAEFSSRLMVETGWTRLATVRPAGITSPVGITVPGRKLMDL